MGALLRRQAPQGVARLDGPRGALGLAILAVRRLAPRPARTPPRGGLAKSAPCRALRAAAELPMAEEAEYGRALTEGQAAFFARRGRVAGPSSIQTGV